MIPLATHETPKITIDHTGFYRNGNTWNPVLNDLLFPLNLSDIGILEKLDAHIDKVLHFAKEIYPQVKESILGVSLYQGAFDFSRAISQDEQERYEDFCKEHPNTFYTQPLFRAHLLSEYLHRLVAFLPEELPIFVFLDVSTLSSLSLIAKLLCSSRFKYIHLGVKGTPLPIGVATWEKGSASYSWLGNTQPKFRKVPSLGILLPCDAECTQEAFLALDALLAKLHAQKQEYRLLSEELLAEEWNGIDEIRVIPSALSRKAQRLLAGFEATGGVISQSLVDLKL